jgi:parvulin-like peptidyl-prolyl isomerase
MVEAGRWCRRLAALGIAVFSVAFALAGCGGEEDPEPVPEGSIAVVGDVPITNEQYERRLTSELRGVYPLTGVTSSRVTLDPPRFNRCISEVREQIIGSGGLTRQQLVENCRLQYERLKDSTVSSLIEGQWFIQQAESEGIALEPAEIEERLEQYIALLGENPRQAERRFKGLLEESGLDREDLEVQLRAQIARQVILANASESEPPSDEEVRAFYEANPQAFGKPADRSIEVVAVSSKEKADEARSQIEGGTPAAQVSVELSDDASIRAADGIVKVEQGVENPLVPEVLAEAVFEAPEGELTGPVEADGRWYVFNVLNSTEADVPALETVKEKARRLAAADAASGGVEGALEDLEEEWRGRTLCAEGYVVSQCSNGP